MFTSTDTSQIVLFTLCLLLLTPILGTYMALVYDDKAHPLKKAFSWIERLIYKVCAIDEAKSYSWKGYAVQVFSLNGIGLIFLFLLQIFQAHLPLNPNNLANLSWDLAFNTAASFVTNTNWQAYAGESTMSYLTDILGLNVQNFLSAATGMAVLLVLLRGIRNQLSSEIGNFWVDLTRSIIYILLPLSFCFAIFLCSQGVIQNFSPNQKVEILDSLDSATQLLPMGPAASQIAIKQLGTNGGGFFNTNSAHPFENPSPLSNFFQMLALLLIPSASVYMSGIMLKARKQAYIILGVMFVLFALSLLGSVISEYSSHQVMNIMEGKEQRFGIINSLIWTAATTAASNGSVNSMISSSSPLTGGIACFNIMLGEIVFGGVGCGLYGMFMFVFMTVFLAGLMVGRSPEFMGKKIESREIILVLITMLIPNFLILIGLGMSISLPEALSSILNKGPHGLSEIMYAISSAAGNNGSAFAGLNANTPYYNVLLGIIMLISRFGAMLSVIALSGYLSEKKSAPASSGTFPTDSLLFAVLLIAVIIILGGLTFLPCLILGPVSEHLLMLEGVVF